MSAAAVAARLKLSKLNKKASREEEPVAKKPRLDETLANSADADAASDAVASASTARYSEGETVLGNFKGMGDWDEAVIAGVHADGSYTLDYVDEGLIEEGVPVSRISKLGGADAVASADAVAIAAGDAAGSRMRAAQGGADATPREAGASEAASVPPEVEKLRTTVEEFVACTKWLEKRDGYCFKLGQSGLGYYKDVPLLERALQVRGQWAQRGQRPEKPPPFLTRCPSFVSHLPERRPELTLTASLPQHCFMSVTHHRSVAVPLSHSAASLACEGGAIKDEVHRRTTL